MTDRLFRLTSYDKRVRYGGHLKCWTCGESQNIDAIIHSKESGPNRTKQRCINCALRLSYVAIEDLRKFFIEEFVHSPQFWDFIRGSGLKGNGTKAVAPRT